LPGDLRAQWGDGRQNLVNRLGGDPCLGEAGCEVPGHQREVMHGDAAALMHLAHQCAGVGVRPAECRGKELDLPAFESGHVGACEEAGEFLVSEHATVEIVHHDLQRFVPPDLVVDA
jgi:hypothetical protein